MFLIVIFSKVHTWYALTVYFGIPGSYRAFHSVKNLQNKLGLSCDKLRSALTSYLLAFGLLALAESAYYVEQKLATVKKKQLSSA